MDETAGIVVEGVRCGPLSTLRGEWPGGFHLHPAKRQIRSQTATTVFKVPAQTF
jgi:hypothetical protein